MYTGLMDLRKSLYQTMALAEPSTLGVQAKVRSGVRRAIMDLGYFTIHAIKISR